MHGFKREINNLLVAIYRQIEKIEEHAVKSDINANLSVAEMHMLENIVKYREGARISDLAKDQYITMPSVTSMVSKLIKKGYAVKTRDEKDARQVLVKATKDGKKIDAGHRYFHEMMVRDITKEFTDDEQIMLLKCVTKLNEFFDEKLKEYE